MRAITNDSNMGGMTPTGTKSITTNGTHDVTEYAEANVNVPVGYDLITIGTGYDSRNTYSVSVSSKTTKYKSLTSSSFLLGNVNFYGYAASANANASSNGNPISSYTASSGALSLASRYFSKWHTSDCRPLAYFTYNVYAIVPK